MFDSVGFEFAIKYEVNGQTYWDNNGGNNYFTVVRGYVGRPYEFATLEVPV